METWGLVPWQQALVLWNRYCLAAYGLFKHCEAFTVFWNALLKNYSLNIASEREEVSKSVWGKSWHFVIMVNSKYLLFSVFLLEPSNLESRIRHQCFLCTVILESELCRGLIPRPAFWLDVLGITSWNNLYKNSYSWVIYWLIEMLSSSFRGAGLSVSQMPFSCSKLSYLPLLISALIKEIIVGHFCTEKCCPNLFLNEKVFY